MGRDLLIFKTQIMKTQKNNKLDFRKASIAELNDNELYDVKGGTLTLSSTACSRVVVSIIRITIGTGDDDGIFEDGF